MATVTPNFNWPVPTSTDLVKDGATAIEALGDSIDASLVDLKGGTTGQVLSKNSNTNMDFTWVTDPGGDITGVTAGTGISGGGTSGTVTITNSMATEIAAKGDLIVGTGAATFDNLTVGTNGHTLVADSSAATGLKWAAPAAGGGKVLQVVGATSSSVVTNSTTTPADWISVSITPSAATSKILILFSGNMLLTASTTAFGFFDLFYNNTSTVLLRTGFGLTITTNVYQSLGTTYLHSPASTSALTYKIRLGKDAGTTTSVASNDVYSITALEIGA